MKKAIQKLAGAAFILSALFFATSCGGVDIYKEENLNADLKKKINEHVKPDMKITKMNLFCGNSSSVNEKIAYANVYYTSADGKPMFMYIPIGSGGNFSDKEDTNHMGDIVTDAGRPIVDYNYEMVAKNVQKATDIATAKGFPVSGIGNYRITFDKDPFKDKHEFTILCKSDKGTQLKGRRMVTEYYEFNCVADAHGDVKVIDLETNEEAQ